MKMKQNHITLLLLCAGALLTATSCKKDLFDEEIYNTAVAYNFMIDNADPDHDWCLTHYSATTIRKSDNIVNRVQLLDANPYVTADAQIVAESMVFGSGERLAYTVPVTNTSLFLVGYDVYGNDLGYISVPFATPSLSVSAEDFLKPGAIKTPTYQKFTYIYESDFPIPGDFDYNDMVLRISKKHPELGNMFVVDLTVTLEACGADEVYGAAIQLVGINYDDITKVEIVDGQAMDTGYPLSRTFTSGDVLTRGRQGEAVINLFESAQWALGRTTDELGDIAVIHYNVSRNTSEKSKVVAPVTTTYRIRFKDSDVAHSMTFDRIDPFIIHESSSGGIWEVHTFAHKFDATLQNINTEAYRKNNVSWSLIIPMADFRYTRYGMPLGSYNSDNGEVFGAYDGFTGWMRNRLTNRDWYRTVTLPQLVY